jgi:hypothetical protein
MGTMILVIGGAAFLIMRIMQNEINKQQRCIDKLHFECENYLKVLAEVGAIPETILKQKINQLNNIYGEIKLKIK